MRQFSNFGRVVKEKKEGKERKEMQSQLTIWPCYEPYIQSYIIKIIDSIKLDYINPKGRG